MPPSLINKIIVNLIGTATLVIVLLDIMALAVFVWGIVKFIFAASNPEKLKDAKQILWWGVIGLFVLTSVTGIVIALQTYFGVTSQSIPILQFGPVTIPGFTGSGYQGGGNGGFGSNGGQPTRGGFPSGGSSGGGISGGNGGQPSCNASPPCFCDPRGAVQCPEDQ